MADTPRVGAAETPISELLRNIPRDAVYHWENTSKEPWCLPTCSSPVGLLAHRAADALDVLSLSAAPGGAVSIWSDARSLFVRYAELFALTERYEEASAIADKAAREIEALATRGEAPAEAGEITDRMVTEALKERFTPERYARDHVYLEANFREATRRQLAAALRAQPPAREDAQPVFWMTKTGLRNFQKGTDPEAHVLLRRGGDLRVALYTTPPAPEAEKLPISAGTHWWHPDNDESGFTCWGDAFEDATDGGWDGPVRLERARRLPDVWAVRIDMDTDGDGEADDYEVRLFATEAEALAALQQEG
nr:hypothetical protein [Brevundimonas naejangsanensis]